LGRALYGIAETGTLVFHSGPHSPVLHSFLPLHHLIAVRADAMLRTMEDYWDIVRDSGMAHPRNINLITGTSGTADIEAKNIRGAHGPRFMHIYLIG
ncbi:MAG: lactate utilization protein C, partial [Geminicoccaceae bacterium]